MIHFAPGAPAANLDSVAAANRWGGLPGLSRADIALQSLIRPGSVVTPCLFAGSWGVPIIPRGSSFSSLPTNVILERRRTTSAGVGPWFDWSLNWQLAGGSSFLESLGTFDDFRWRVPRPHTGYLRIEWEEIYFNPVSGGGANEVSISDIVLDDCYRDLWVDGSLRILGNGLTGVNGISSRRVRMTPTSSTKSVVIGSSPAVTIEIGVSASPVTLRGVALEQATNITSAADQYPVTFSPDTGAAATAIAKPLPAGATLAVDAKRVYGVRMDDPGSAPTVALSATATGAGVVLHPKYTGGRVTSLSLGSVSPASFGFGATRAIMVLIPTDWQSGAFKVARLIVSGPVAYVTRSAVFTDWPADYSPNNPQTWRVGDVFSVYQSPEKSAYNNSQLSLPRFWLTP